MQVWRLEPLKRMLAQGPLPDRQAVQYVAAQAALVAAFVVPTPGQDLPPWWHFVAAPAIAVGGVYFCYRQNGGAAGQRFTERYFSIGWVVAVRVAIVSLAPACVGSVLVFAWLQPGVSDDPPAGLVELVSYGVMAIAFWRTGVHMADVFERARALHIDEAMDARDA